VDKLVGRMIEMGLNDAVINAGGSTIRAINNSSHPLWQVKVRNPQDDELLFNLEIGNQCYSTSTQTKTFVEIDGKQYGHILNPVTGYPSVNKQIGIVTDNCLIGDILSTALYNETSESFLDRMNLISGYYNAEGFLMDENNKITCTDGFRYD